jgi:hypothetical protein
MPEMYEPGGIVKMERYDVKDKHLGQQCFIIGNAPSFMNLSLIKNEILIGIDDAYMKGLNYTYYFVYDLKNWNKHYPHLLELDAPLFISNTIYDDYIYMQPNYPRYCKGGVVIARFTEEPHNSLEMALTMGHTLGFKKVFLLGCENYQSPLLPKLKNMYWGDNREIIDCRWNTKLFYDEIYHSKSPKCQICGSKTRFDCAHGRIFSVCESCEFVSVIENR